MINNTFSILYYNPTKLKQLHKQNKVNNSTYLKTTKIIIIHSLSAPEKQKTLKQAHTQSHLCQDTSLT